MEGYFPIYKYCEITGCNKDTAYHRAERGTIEAFKGKDGRWFIYFSDNREAFPEGFITVEEYANKIGVRKSTVFGRIRNGYFDEKDTILSVVIDPNGHPVNRRLIRETVEWKDFRDEFNKKHAHGIMNALRPEGAYTISEYAKILGKEQYYIRNRIKNGHMKFTMVGGHYFVYPEKEETA